MLTISLLSLRTIPSPHSAGILENHLCAGLFKYDSFSSLKRYLISHQSFGNAWRVFAFFDWYPLVIFAFPAPNDITRIDLSGLEISAVLELFSEFKYFLKFYFYFLYFRRFHPLSLDSSTSK